MSPKAFRELGDKFGTNPAGTGPFKFVEYRPGQHLIVDANPAYWGRKPAVQRIRYRFIPENGTRMAALEAGEVMLVDHWANTKRTMHANAEVDRLLVDARETFDDARVSATSAPGSGSTSSPTCSRSARSSRGSPAAATSTCCSGTRRSRDRVTGEPA